MAPVVAVKLNPSTGKAWRGEFPIALLIITLGPFAWIRQLPARKTAPSGEFGGANGATKLALCRRQGRTGGAAKWQISPAKYR